MIVIQHMPGCRALLVGLPCGCSRTELPDPPNNRYPPVLGHYHPPLDRVCWAGTPCVRPLDQLIEDVPRPSSLTPPPDPGCPVCFGQGYKHCGLATHEGGRGCGERCEFCRPRERWTLIGRVTDAPRQWAYAGPDDQVSLLHIDDFSHYVYPEVRKIASWVPISEELIWNTNPVMFQVTEDMLRLFDPDWQPPSDTERALRNLERPIDYTTDWQIRKARWRTTRLMWRRRLADLLLGNEPYGEDDYEW